MRAIEFYTTPSGEVTIKEQGQPERQLKESDTDFIQSFLEILEEFYTEAYAALRKYYARYDGNKCYRDFLAVRRFIKCNFGLYDNMIDVDENWNFKFEFVHHQARPARRLHRGRDRRAIQYIIRQPASGDGALLLWQERRRDRGNAFHLVPHRKEPPEERFPETLDTLHGGVHAIRERKESI